MEKIYYDLNSEKLDAFLKSKNMTGLMMQMEKLKIIP